MPEGLEKPELDAPPLGPEMGDVIRPKPKKKKRPLEGDDYEAPDAPPWPDERDEGDDDDE